MQGQGVVAARRAKRGRNWGRPGRGGRGAMVEDGGGRDERGGAFRSKPGPPGCEGWVISRFAIGPSWVS